LLALLSAERDRLDRRLTELAKVRDRLDAGITAATSGLRTGEPCRPPRRACGEL
jgi:hypothetical protein